MLKGFATASDRIIATAPGRGETATYPRACGVEHPKIATSHSQKQCGADVDVSEGDVCAMAGEKNAHGVAKKQHVPSRSEYRSACWQRDGHWHTRGAWCHFLQRKRTIRDAAQKQPFVDTGDGARVKEEQHSPQCCHRKIRRGCGFQSKDNLPAEPCKAYGGSKPKKPNQVKLACDCEDVWYRLLTLHEHKESGEDNQGIEGGG